MFNRRIYLDYAALTPVDPHVLREVEFYSAHAFANPSSLYKEGVAAKKVLEQMRKKVADTIHAHADEIVFTSGGTEANDLALEAIGRAARHGGNIKPHFIISTVEHSSIKEIAAMLERNGCEVTKIPVDADGIISLDELKKAIKPSTILVSVMTVNNETGSIQPLKEIAHIIRKAKAANKNSVYPLFHTDAAQAFLYQELFVEKLGVDLMTLDGTKVYGQRGVGCLFVKRGTPIEPIMYGGGQEKGIRSGTENVPGIAGFAKALELASDSRVNETKRIEELKARFIDGLKLIKPDFHINGADSITSPHIVNVSIPGIDNEFFLFQLDAKGIACSTKSSCLRDEDESYVLKAMGADSKSSIRFSFGRWTTKSDIDKVLKAIKAI